MSLCARTVILPAALLGLAIEGVKHKFRTRIAATFAGRILTTEAERHAPRSASGRVSPRRPRSARKPAIRARLERISCRLKLLDRAAFALECGHFPSETSLQMNG